MAIKEDIRTVAKAFDKWIFIRSTKDDHKPDWLINLAPYISALGRLQDYADTIAREDNHNYAELRDLAAGESGE